MSIASAILALTPSIYWKLDEPAGPTAFDSSGNGNNGNFQPNTTFQVPGPESGTFGIASPVSAAGVIRNGNPVFGVVAKSMVCWVAMQSGANVGPRVMYEGNPASTGIGITANPSVPKTTFDFDVFFAQDTGQNPTLQKWQLWAFTFAVGGGGTSTFQIDLGGVATMAGHTPHASLAADPVHALTPGAATLAHFALFNYVLTNAQIQGIYTGAVGLTTSSTLTGRAASDFDVASLGTVLNDQAATLDAILAAVRKSYTA